MKSYAIILYIETLYLHIHNIIPAVTIYKFSTNITLVHYVMIIYSVRLF